MTEPDPRKQLPNDDEIAAMIRQAEGGDAKRARRKGKDTEPSPRFPEAAYFHVFLLVEAAIVIGVWGYMRRGPAEALKGPGLDAPVMTQIGHYLHSIIKGLTDVVTMHPWLPAGIFLASLAVFVPRNKQGRKRVATAVSIPVVGVFLTLIALRFAGDMASIS